MKTKELLDYCLAKKGAYLDFPFGPPNADYATVKVKAPSQTNGKIFAELFVLHGEEKFTFSTDPDTALFLRERSPDCITRGWHWPPVGARYRSTATISRIADDELKLFADLSYERTFAKLPRCVQREILGE